MCVLAAGWWEKQRPRRTQGTSEARVARQRGRAMTTVPAGLCPCSQAGPSGLGGLSRQQLLLADCPGNPGQHRGSDWPSSVSAGVVVLSTYHNPANPLAADNPQLWGDADCHNVRFPA